MTGSKHTEEAVSSAFLRADVALFERRLKLVGGLRAEQTNIDAEGPLTDTTRNYSLTRRIALFTNLRNIGDATEDAGISGPSTPAHAQFRSRLDFGSLWTFGLKGTF